MELFTGNEPASTKQKILETAIELFSRNGYSAISVREITKHVGIKESALYNHFKTKDEILETIYSIFRTESRKSLPPVEKLDDIFRMVSPEDFLKQGFERFKVTVSNPLLMKMWRILNIEQFRDNRAREIIVEDIYKRTIDFLEAAFGKLIESKRIKPYDARLLACEYQYPIFTIMTEYLLLTFDGKDTDELERRVEMHIKYFVENVALGRKES